VHSEGAHRKKKRKIRRTGQHCAPSNVPPAVKFAGFAVPVLAVGAIAVAQFQPFSPDPVADSMASYMPQDAQRTTAQGPSSAAGSGSSHATESQSGRGVAERQTTSEAAAALTARISIAKSAAAAKAAANVAAKVAKSAGQSPASKQPATGATTLKCGPSSGPVPANYAAIVTFLARHGYTATAAAGIAGNIYQESKGNPESVGTGGGGLIGWTPLPAGFVTGNPAADLQTQLTAILTYNQQWAQYIPSLNAATTATQAADIYMSYFERPGLPAAANREAAASAVAQACGIG